MPLSGSNPHVPATQVRICSVRRRNFRLLGMSSERNCVDCVASVHNTTQGGWPKTHTHTHTHTHTNTHTHTPLTSTKCACCASVDAAATRLAGPAVDGVDTHEQPLARFLTVVTAVRRAVGRSSRLLNVNIGQKYKGMLLLLQMPPPLPHTHWTLATAEVH